MTSLEKAPLAIYQEARSLDRKQPQDAPESSEGSNVPPDWESVAKKQREAIDAALVFLRQDWPKAAEKALELVPDIGLGRTLYPLAPNAVIKGP